MWTFLRVSMCLCTSWYTNTYLQRVLVVYYIHILFKNSNIIKKISFAYDHNSSLKPFYCVCTTYFYYSLTFAFSFSRVFYIANCYTIKAFCTVFLLSLPIPRKEKERNRENEKWLISTWLHFKEWLSTQYLHTVCQL